MTILKDRNHFCLWVAYVWCCVFGHKWLEKKNYQVCERCMSTTNYPQLVKEGVIEEDVLEDFTHGI